MELEKPQNFLGYSYSEEVLVQGFDAQKYNNIMKVENAHYVYDKQGFLMAVLCAPTKKQAVRECKRYIIQKRLNLVPIIHYFNNLFKVHAK